MSQTENKKGGEEAKPPACPKQPIDAKTLKSVTDNMAPQAGSAGSFVRRLRDEDRY